MQLKHKSSKLRMTVWWNKHINPSCLPKCNGSFSPVTLAAVLQGCCDIVATEVLCKPQNSPNMEKCLIHIHFSQIPLQIMKLISLDSISQLKLSLWTRRPQPTTILSKHCQLFLTPSVSFPPLPLSHISVYAVAQGNVIYRRKMLYKRKNGCSFKLFSASRPLKASGGSAPFCA